MSISYNKDVRVVFLVQEGLEKVREATEEDFLRAGYVPASGRGNVNAPEGEESSEEECGPSCEGCGFGLGFGEDERILIDLTSLPHFEGILDPFKLYAEDRGLNFKRFTSDLLNDATLFNPLRFMETKKKAEPASEEKASPVEEFAGDIFKGAFNVFNTVKSGLADLLEPVEYPESAKPDAKESAPVTPEPVKEEAPAEEKPEFNEFEQTVIGKFEEMGLGADAKSAMRKSKEFAEFLSSKSPTPEQAKAFAEMLKNGKPPFFG